MSKNNKIIILSVLSTFFLAGCNTEEEKKYNFEVKDCQNSVLGILNSGFDAVISDAITLEAKDSQANKLKLSEDICKSKNPMYFRN